MAKPDLVYTTYIKTTPEKLWAALTTPEFTRQYWGGSANVSSWQKGAAWEHIDEDGTVHHVGIVEDIVPCQRLVLSWGDPAGTPDISRVTFTLQKVQDTVRLDIVHGDFIDGSLVADRVSKGWPVVVASLKSYMETGAPLNIWSCASCDTKDAAA